MILSRKLVTAIVTNILVWGGTWAVTKLGLGDAASTATAISSVAGVVAGAFAGWLVREVPGL